jgi:hypothetical protein
MQPDFALFALAAGFLYLITAAALVPWTAQQKGRSGFAWMLIALVWTPLFALIALAAVPVKSEDQPEPYAQRLGDSEIPEFKWQKR